MNGPTTKRTGAGAALVEARNGWSGASASPDKDKGSAMADR